MLEEQAQRDHDLLIEINTKLTLFIEMFTSHKRDTDNEISNLKKEVDALKEGRVKDTSFKAGAKWAIGAVAAAIGAIPPSLILFAMEISK